MGGSVEGVEYAAFRLMERGHNPDEVRLKMATMFLKHTDAVQKGRFKAPSGGNDAGSD